MKILSGSVEFYKAMLKKRKAIALTVLGAVLVVNVLLSIFRTDATHTAFLVTNIVTDIACLWFLFAFYSFGIRNKEMLVRLADTPTELRMTLTGTVDQIEERTQTVSRLLCNAVRLSTDASERVVFVAFRGELRLECGKTYTVSTADNIVIAAEETI